PVIAVVERYVGAFRGTGIEQAAADGVRAHDRYEFPGRQAGIDLPPGLAVVVGAKHMRTEPVLTVIVHGRVGGRRIERRSVEGAHLLPRLQDRRSHVLPVLT